MTDFYGAFTYACQCAVNRKPGRLIEEIQASFALFMRLAGVTKVAKQESITRQK